MNTQKIDSQEKQNPGFSRECNYEYVNQQPWNNMGNIRGSDERQNPKPSNNYTIMSGFQSPESAFYATERCMIGFQFPSRENFSVESESLPKSQICFIQYQKPSEMSYQTSCSSALQGIYVPTPDQHIIRNHFPVHFGPNQDQRAYCNPPARAQPNYFHQEKQSSSGTTVLASKTRIRWTQDLHDKFVECIKRLGGAEKATPKAILKLMDTEGLTIFHVKSHLQKYRMAKYMPDSAEGNSEKRSITNDVTQIDVNTGLHLTQALQLQLDVQVRLHEQLEIQQNLQMRIEEQGRQLKMMIDQQQKANESLIKRQDSDITSFEDHEPSFSLEEVEASIVESSGNAHFPTKIS